MNGDFCKKIINEKLFPVYVAVLCFSVTVFTFYPGLMSFDSLYQLREARDGAISNAHSPVMGFIWGQMDLVWSGPQGMLFFHNLIFFSAILLLAFTFFDTNKKRMFFIMLITFFPPVFGFLGIIWKDVGMGVCLLLAFSCFAFSRQHNSAIMILPGLLALLYANLSRHNAFAAVLPICFYSGFVIQELFLFRKRAVINFLFGLVIFVVLTGGGFVIDMMLTSKRISPSQAVFTYDLAGISIEIQENLLPESTYGAKCEVMDVSTINKNFSRRNAAIMYEPDVNGESFIKKLDDPKELRDLRDRWFWAVISHPVAYFMHRCRLMRIHYAAFTPQPVYFLNVVLGENRSGLRQPSALFQRRIVWILSKITKTFLIRPIIYILVLIPSVLLWVKCYKLKLKEELLTIVFSVLFLCGLNFIALLAAPVRYFWWPFLAIFLYILLLVMGVEKLGLRDVKIEE